MQNKDENANYAEYTKYAKYSCRLGLTGKWTEVRTATSLQRSSPGASSAKWVVQYAQFAKYATIYAMIRNKKNRLNMHNMQLNMP